jgi:hypothetical protein
MMTYIPSTRCAVSCSQNWGDGLSDSRRKMMICRYLHDNREELFVERFRDKMIDFFRSHLTSFHARLSSRQDCHQCDKTF